MAGVAHGERDELGGGQSAGDHRQGPERPWRDDIGQQRLVQTGRVARRGTIGPTEPEQVEREHGVALSEGGNCVAPFE